MAEPSDDFLSWINSEDFYNLMQLYRFASMQKQENVVERFEAVKSFIRQNIRKSAQNMISVGISEMIMETVERYCPEKKKGKK